jgi:hypothetical protein
MRSMPPAAERRLVQDLAAARHLTADGDVEGAWRSLEEAHVLSQPWALPHARVHWRMLVLAVRTRDRREVSGQLPRLFLAAPGSWAGRYPVGNTGRTAAGLMTSMPMSDEVAQLLSADLPDA